MAVLIDPSSLLSCWFVYFSGLLLSVGQCWLEGFAVDVLLFHIRFGGKKKDLFLKMLNLGKRQVFDDLFLCFLLIRYGFHESLHKEKYSREVKVRVRVLAEKRLGEEMKIWF